MTRRPSPWKLSGVGGNRWERRFIPRHSACKSWPMGAAAMVRGCGCGKLNFRNWPRNWASPSKFATYPRRLANGTRSSTGCSPLLGMNWSGKPLVSHEVIVNLIKATKTAQGLRVEAEIDHTIYPAGQKVSDEQMAQINLTTESFHGEWNYTIAPLQQQLKL